MTKTSETPANQTQGAGIDTDSMFDAAQSSADSTTPEMDAEEAAWHAAAEREEAQARQSAAAKAASADTSGKTDGFFPALSDSGVRRDDTARDLSMLMDIPVQLTVELGRTRIPIKSILHLAQGSVVELDALAGEPMDVLVNGCLIAQGEVVVVNDRFGVRLTDIVTPAERLRRLNR